MIGKIITTLFFGILATLGTILAASWWWAFGVHEVYPYIMTVASVCLWSSTILAATEKED